MLHQSIKDFLEKNNVVEINPVLENSRSSRKVGYHYQVEDFKKQWELMLDLEVLIKKKQLSYSLSEYNGKGDFILFLNN